MPFNGTLKLVPHGDLFTQGCDDKGKLARLPPEQWLRYYFHLAADGAAVQLTQVIDEYGFMPPYGFRGGPAWQAPVRLSDCNFASRSQFTTTSPAVARSGR